MIERVDITDEQRSRARRLMAGFKVRARARTNQYGHDLKRKVVGTLGEVVMADYMGVPPADLADDFDYDFIHAALRVVEAAEKWYDVPLALDREGEHHAAALCRAIREWREGGK